MDLAGGICPIGEQYQHAVFGGSVAQSLDSESDGVTYGSLLSREPDHGFLEQRPHRRPVEGERRLQIGARAEQNEPDAIAVAALDEFPSHLLDHGEPRIPVLANLHVPAFHAAREVHGKHQIPAGDAQRDRFAHPLRARSREHQQQPRAGGDHHPPAT